MNFNADRLAKLAGLPSGQRRSLNEAGNRSQHDDSSVSDEVEWRHGKNQLAEAQEDEAGFLDSLGEGQGYDDREDESLGMRRGKQAGKHASAKGRRDDSYGKWGSRGEEDRDTSLEEGEHQGYDDREDESLGMRRGKQAGKHSSARGRRDDSYGKWGKRGEEDRDTSLEVLQDFLDQALDNI
jgi:hypothetical protein